MKIRKASGENVEFRPAKVRETLKRIGAKPETIDHVIANVTKAITEGMSTRDVFAIVRRELKKEDRCLAHRYNLRKGLLKLGPAGFKFEKYVASILQAYEYETSLPQDELSGLCVRHEVDVVAKSPSRVIMIEAKFRNRFDDTVTLKDAMATWARLIDLREGAKAGKKTPHFDEAWIVTNGRFSDRSQQFGVCKGMQLIGWSTEESSLARMVDHAALYPITVIDDLRQWELDSLEKKGYMLCREIAQKKPDVLAKQTGIASDRATKLVTDCKEIVNIG